MRLPLLLVCSVGNKTKSSICVSELALSKELFVANTRLINEVGISKLTLTPNHSNGLYTFREVYDI